MYLTLPEWGQILTIAILAIVLGIDALSVGIGIGIKRLTWRNNLLFSFFVGVFHIIMPLLGFMIGKSVGNWLEEIAVIIGGSMLILLGAHMIYKSIQTENEIQMIESRRVTKLTLLAIALSVSIDSLSVGLSLGLFQVDILFTILMFGFAGFLLSSIGLSIGKMLGRMIGNYGEVAGGMILITLGIEFIW